MLKNIYENQPTRATRAPDSPECCSKAKCDIQKHTTKLAGQGDQGARTTGVLFKSKKHCSKTPHKVEPLRATDQCARITGVLFKSKM